MKNGPVFHFLCSGYNKKSGCSSHDMLETDLTEIVLSSINGMILKLCCYDELARSLEPGDEVKLWRIGTISNILHNQSYIGNLVQGKRRERHYKGEERHFTNADEWIIVEDKN